MNKSALMAAVCFSLGLFALGGCGDTAAGETLDVVAEPSSQPRNIRGGETYSFNPRVIYLGAKDLAYEWSMVSASGYVLLEDANTKFGSITCDDLGTYKVKFRVYESNGTISTSDTATYVVTEVAPVGVSLTAVPGSVTYSEGARGTATLNLTITGGALSQGFGIEWAVDPLVSSTGIRATFSGSTSGIVGSRATSNSISFSQGSATDTGQFEVRCTVTNAGATVSTSATIAVLVGATG